MRGNPDWQGFAFPFVPPDRLSMVAVAMNPPIYDRRSFVKLSIAAGAVSAAPLAMAQERIWLFQELEPTFPTSRIRSHRTSMRRRWKSITASTTRAISAISTRP